MLINKSVLQVWYESKTIELHVGGRFCPPAMTPWARIHSLLTLNTHTLQP